jgi:hypothetical protein
MDLQRRRQVSASPTFCYFSRPGSVGGVEVDLLDELNVGQE